MESIVEKAPAVDGGLCLLEMLDVLEMLGMLEMLEMLEVPEVMHRVLRCMWEAVEGELCLSQVLEVLGEAWRGWGGWRCRR